MTAAERGRSALLTTMDFPPTRGGIQTMTREIVARAQRFTFDVIAPADAGAEVFDRTIPTSVRRVGRVLPGRRGYAPTIALASYRHARATRPSVALAMHTLAAPGPLLARVSTVVVCHGGELRSPRIRRVARLVLPRAARVIANSRYTRSVAVALGADPLRITVVPVGAPEAVAVDPSRVAAVRERIGARFVLTIARLAPHKGHDTAIDSLPLLPPDVRWVFVGDGDERARLAERARARGVDERVIFAGSVGDDDLPAYLAAADAFALLSRETSGGVEGGGIVLLEACAYGVPVVAARSGGIPETITDNDTGLLVDPADPAAVARALTRLLEDGALAGRLRDRARALATGERSWARSVERIEDVLETAALRPAGSSR